MYNEYTNISPFVRMRSFNIEQLEEMKAFYVDRWTWETGSPIDKAIFKWCEERIAYLKYVMNIVGFDINDHAITITHC